MVISEDEHLELDRRKPRSVLERVPCKPAK